MRPIQISNSYRYVTSPDGKVTIEKNEAAILAKLPVNKKIAHRSSKKVTFKAVTK